MTAPRARLDAELVRRGLARSREQAGELVEAGLVAVAGQRASKPATQVARDAPITVAESGEPRYVSRGGYKLAGALAVFGGPGGNGGTGSPLVREVPGGSSPVRQHSDLAVAGRRCLDAGASTGGFTDVLLRAGAAHVVAADVGYGQLAWSLRTDPRVTVMDRVNVRTLGQVTPVPDLVVADLSFISLTVVLPALTACATPEADFVLLVKPQFEVGKGRVGAGGVVRDTADRSAAVEKVCGAAAELGLGVRGITASPLPGPAGNVEYFVWLRRGAPPLDKEQLRRAIAEGPKGPAGPEGNVPPGNRARASGARGASGASGARGVWGDGEAPHDRGARGGRRDGQSPRAGGPRGVVPRETTEEGPC